MKAAVIRFPGSNCDQDCYHVLKNEFALDTEYVWHKEASVEQFDLIVLPGGFSYGDYLRCGAIARFSPVMRSVAAEAERGKLVLGICNGFQILCEARLLPGALIRNRSLHFVCEHVEARLENMETAFTHTEVTKSDGKLLTARTGLLLRMPVAHGEGNYTADEETLRDLNRHNQIVLRYADKRGALTGRGEPERLGGKYRGHHESRGKCVRADAAPGAGVRPAAGERGWEADFSVGDRERGRRSRRASSPIGKRN